MTNNKYCIAIFIAILFSISCKKYDTVIPSAQNETSNTSKKNVPPPGFFIEDRKVPGVASNERAINVESSPTNSDLHNGDEPIILGQQLPNPYSIANMQMAINILYGGSYPITATHLYVRFKPASTEQLLTLEETEDLELQDYPIDYELLQDGDYYQDPTLGTEDFHWLYTVVPVNYQFPNGIQKEIIEQLYLPIDNEILEDMAESMVLGATYVSQVSTETQGDALPEIEITRTDLSQNIEFNFTPDPCSCNSGGGMVIDPQCDGGEYYACGGGGGGNSTNSNRGIFVEEQTVCSQPSTTVPLRQVRVIAKRWFKFWRGYTNDNGQFTVTKNFKNKVKVIVKTKNDFARVSKVRGLRLWQMLLPTRKRVGVFHGADLPNVRYVFTKPTDGSASSKELPYWASATTHNAIVEFRQYTTEFGLPQPPLNLKVIVTNWSFMENTAAAPMWNKCNTIEIGPYIYSIMTGNYWTAGVYTVLATLRNQMDLIIGYKSTDYNCRLTSSELRSTVYHEMGHAQHFNQAGCGFWTEYRNGIASELTSSGFSDSYGNGTASTAPIIGVGEMWGYFAEKWYSERHYGNGGALANSFFARSQGQTFGNNVGAGLNANFWAIESFDPIRAQDRYRWIPAGLPYDLWDPRNDAGNPIIDNVVGFTINQSFNALQTDVRSIPAFRARLLQQNGNLQLLQVNNLFNEYRY